MKETILKSMEKRVQMLKNQYAIAYSTKDQKADILEMYYKSIDEMKKDIITGDPALVNGDLNVAAKIRLYQKNENILITYSIEIINNALENPENKRMDPGFFFALKAEQTIRNYFKNAPSTNFVEFGEQCVELNKEFAKRVRGELEQSNSSKESTNFDPKKEIRMMYKQLNKREEKDELRGQIKEQLVQYFAGQSKKQQSFYDVSDSETFTKWGISNMADIFKENPEKAEVNLETIKTKVLEDRKKELKKELKQEFKKNKKTFEKFKNASKSSFISAIEPGKRKNLKELTFLREELRMREQLKKAEKQFGIKLDKIFGEETTQVKKEFCHLLRSEDSLVNAVKIMQQYFPDNSGPNKVNSLEAAAKSFSEAVKQFPQPQPQSRAQLSNLRSILERLPGIRRLAPVKQATKVGERVQTNIFLHEFEQQRKSSVAQSNLLNSNTLKKQPLTASRDRH